MHGHGRILFNIQCLPKIFCDHFAAAPETFNRNTNLGLGKEDITSPFIQMILKRINLFKAIGLAGKAVYVGIAVDNKFTAGVDDPPLPDGGSAAKERN